jgi:hypothetical protein
VSHRARRRNATLPGYDVTGWAPVALPRRSSSLGRIEPGSGVLYAHLGGRAALNAYAGAVRLSRRWWRADALLPPEALGGEFYGVDDPLVAGAATDVAGQLADDLVPRGPRVLGEQGDDANDEARGAESAL